MAAAPARPVSGDPAAARPVLQGPEVGRVIDRMAHELLEKTRGGTDVVLLGIPTRGLPLAERLARREGLADAGRKPAPVVLPAIALAIAIVSFAFGAVSNILSRQVEARADAFSLDLTRDPAAFVQFERRIALRNVSDPDPPTLLHTLFGTHPTTLERIGYGVTWARHNGEG